MALGATWSSAALSSGGYSSIGRARRSHRRGWGFEPPYLHQIPSPNPLPVASFYPIIALYWWYKSVVGGSKGGSKMGNLTAAQLRKINEPGRYGDGAGLYLVVSPGGSRYWIQRIRLDGMRTDKGLGRLTDVSLTE